MRAARIVGQRVQIKQVAPQEAGRAADGQRCCPLGSRWNGKVCCLGAIDANSLKCCEKVPAVLPEGAAQWPLTGDG